MATSLSPSNEDYISASNIVYDEASSLATLQVLINQGVPYDSSFKTWTPLLISSMISPTYAADGMYADAFLTGNGQVVIAFEGTDKINTQLWGPTSEYTINKSPKLF